MKLPCNKFLISWSLVHVFKRNVCSICGKWRLQDKKNEDSIKCIPKYSLILCMGVEMDKEKLQVGRKRGVSLHSKRKMGIFFHHYCFLLFWELEKERKGEELGRSKKETRGKTSRLSGKNWTSVRWKEEEKVPLVL